MLRYHFPFLVLLLAAGSLASQPVPVKTDSSHPANKAALIYGPLHAFTIKAPDNWLLDSKSGLKQGLQAVFYPNGERWATSPSVMYCQVVQRGNEIKDREGMMEYDRNRFRNGSPSATVADQPAIALAGGKSAAVRKFAGGARGTFEQTAYIEERTVVVMLVLSCRTEEALTRSADAFSQFVRSYTFLADDRENILRAIEAAELEEAQ